VCEGVRSALERRRIARKSRKAPRQRSPAASHRDPFDELENHLLIPREGDQAHARTISGERPMNHRTADEPRSGFRTARSHSVSGSGIDDHRPHDGELLSRGRPHPGLPKRVSALPG